MKQIVFLIPLFYWVSSCGGADSREHQAGIRSEQFPQYQDDGRLNLLSDKIKELEEEKNDLVEAVKLAVEHLSNRAENIEESVREFVREFVRKNKKEENVGNE